MDLANLEENFVLKVLPKDLWIKVAKRINDRYTWYSFSSTCSLFDSITNGAIELKCVLYYTKWCKFCKEVMPVWDEFAKRYHTFLKKDGKMYKIFVEKVDCDHPHQKLVVDEKITGYPTIRFCNNTSWCIIEYTDDRTLEGFEGVLDYLFENSLVISHNNYNLKYKKAINNAIIKCTIKEYM
jgi:thiol-disulfide isomerase/thioredoxin